MNTVQFLFVFFVWIACGVVGFRTVCTDKDWIVPIHCICLFVFTVGGVAALFSLLFYFSQFLGTI